MMDKQKTRGVSKAAGAGLFGRGALKTLTVSIALAFGIVPAQALAQEAPVQISIPAQSLGNALIQLGEQASLQIFYLPETVSGLNAPAVAGNLTSDQALQRLLAGTGIEVKRNGNTVSLSKPASGTTTQLAPIMVHGTLDPTSEGSGSYAAEAVTIGKSVLTLKEIPQSVSVVTQQQIQDQGFTSVTEALHQAPGVITGGRDNGEIAIIRGFGSSKQYDGMVLQEGSDRMGLHQDLAMFDRVEVLRGPAGLLTGSGSLGGTINYVAKRPRHELGISGTVSAGSWNHYRGELDITGPLNKSGTLRGRAVMALQDEDKFYDVDHSRHEFFYGILEYDLTPKTTVGLAFDYIHRKYTSSFYGIPLYSDGSKPPRTSFAGTETPSSYESTGISVDLNHRFDNDWNLKAAYRHRKADGDTYDYYVTSNGVDPITGLANINAQNTVAWTKWENFDISASGPIELLGKKHHFTFGYDRSTQNVGLKRAGQAVSNWDVFNNHDLREYFDKLNANNVPTENQNAYIQSGIYASGRIKLADPLTLVVGGRWTSFESRSRTVPTAQEWSVSEAKASREFTPYGGLIWDVNDQLSLYTSYTDTFVPQSQVDYSGKTLDPRVGWQAEAGAKATFFDGRLNASLAVFRIRDTNRAIPDPDHVGCGGTATGRCYVGSGLIQSEGWEAEISGSPVPGWDIAASYTYTRAKYLRDSNPENDGTRYNTFYTPVHLFKLWSQYRFGRDDMGGALQGWTVGAGVYAQSGVYGSRTLTEARQSGYATVDFKLGYKINKNWDANLYVENVFDREYLSTLSNSLMFNNFYGRPRSAMLSLRGTF
ncbi:TonB-dependent siderophore receptor [Pusillimonas noertemannii]|uniref:Outer membrane receptor for ferric coprogen and ferric-rhodotorulic acid n=1 Tax=Pusillimonas noertemannii TaxID=305977 RepID=A0A2U1CMA0_9BURK|nr:TonB-dependent receptor [Pusillimonas noertemannii]NYT68862.1 TonB-dependent siderophore receptor [Pusillimonas noertemannii]PVY62117.1 outer membrane receptor for ferric coprogen and ferric-rhodotorulic acid [Pusillimonas noertemannii]TFL10890.1 TonB-dependent siderophore receptor [Pusillimonas noertemannii]